MASLLWGRQCAVAVAPVAFGGKLSSIQALPLQGCALLNVFHNLSVPWYPLLPLKYLEQGGESG